jgi:anti-sigma B factor antagonist
VQAPVSTNRSGSLVTVVLTGEIDVATSAAVEAAVAGSVAAEGVTAVEVDLSDVDFLDSSGISALLMGRRNAEERQLAFRVMGARGVTRRVLEMTGVWAHLSGDPDPT